MGTKKTISKLSKNDEEFFASRAIKDRKLAVQGKWDSNDTHNLQLLFEQYDRATGGRLKRFCNDLRVERELNSNFLLKSAEKEEKLAFALPQDLQLFMEKYYPTIWTNPEHARQFLKHFPQFRR